MNFFSTKSPNLSPNLKKKKFSLGGGGGGEEGGLLE